jgi:hypothetical protein
MRYRNRLYIFILLIAPFLFLFPYILPLKIDSYNLSISNDFRILYFNYKAYLLYFLGKFELPFWSPSEACGYPFYSNPFTQFFYPLNIILLIYYKIVGNYLPVDHLRFSVLGISIFSIGIFNWLKSIKINPLPAFMSAFIISLSFGSIEAIRLPNAIHTICWFPWALFAISKIFAANKTAEYVKYSLFLLFSLICAISAGYPYYMFYSLFIFIPYFILYLFTNQRLYLFGNNKKNIKTAIISLIITIIIAGLISFPYIKSMLELMNLTTHRTGNNYEFSLIFSENPLSTLGSFIYPPISGILHCFYFGLLNLIIIIFYFLNSKSNVFRNFNKWILLIWIALIIYITYGSQSLLFNFFWNYLPFFSRLREWGMLNKILIILIAWVLGYAFSNLLNIINCKQKQTKTTKIILSTVTIAIFIFILTSTILKFNSTQWNEFFVLSKVEMLRIFNPALSVKASHFLTNYEYIFVIFSLTSCILLFLFYKNNYYCNINNKRNIIIIILLFSALESYSFSPWLWVKAEKQGKFYNLNIDNRVAFETQRTFKYNTVSLNNSFNAGIISDWYYDSYIEFLKKYNYDTLNLNKLLGVSNNNKLFFTNGINHPDLKSFFTDVDTNISNINIKNYTGNALEVELDVKYDGYLNFIDNASENWTALVNGQHSDIIKLFGTFKSVFVPKGINNVKFIYIP